MKSRTKALLGDRSFLIALAVFVSLIFGVQHFGGAFQAEYDGHPDEAAHFVSSLMVRDYLAQFPWPSPLPWAINYYVHYPKVAIGHWPPGYYALQGVWWLFVPPGRASAMFLNLLMGAGLMTVFWVLIARLGVSRLVMGGMGVAMLTLPIMQQAVSQVMAELPALVASLVFLWALTRVQESPGRPWLMAVWLTLFAAFVVKQTSVGLAAAPVLALAFSGRWRRIPRGPLFLWPAMAITAAGMLLFWQYGGSFDQIMRWSGAASRFNLRWSFPQVLDIVGGGIILMAVGGAIVAWRHREPVLVASLAIVISFAMSSYYVRAFSESRHWIALVPPLCLLAAAGYRDLSERNRWLALAALLVTIALMPHELYRQVPAGYEALAGQIRQPARMLVSSPGGWAEGPWIAVAALRESRPGSVIVRATKLLASTDWNERYYHLKVNTEQDVERSLDGAGIDLVVIHDDPKNNGKLLHHPLLRATVTGSSTWKRCGEAGALAAYCRQQPPRYPRLPLQIELNRMGVTSIGENP